MSGNPAIEKGLSERKSENPFSLFLYSQKSQAV